MNVGILIHGLRSRFLKLDDINKNELAEFFCHLVKHTRHIIRNEIFIKFGL